MTPGNFRTLAVTWTGVQGSPGSLPQLKWPVCGGPQVSVGARTGNSVSTQLPMALAIPTVVGTLVLSVPGVGTHTFDKVKSDCPAR